jgi:hypothetical protein
MMEQGIMKAICQFFASFEIVCPVCGAVVPSNTQHACEVIQKPAKPKRLRKPARDKRPF